MRRKSQGAKTTSHWNWQAENDTMKGLTSQAKVCNVRIN